MYSPTPVHAIDPRVEWRNSCFPADNILNFSHICLGIDPANPHYGRHGDYHASLPAPPDDGIAYKGAKLPAATKKNPHYRLTYNPDFGNLLQRMDGFLDSLEDAVVGGEDGDRKVVF